jgi:hypothetical protein
LAEWLSNFEVSLNNLRVKVKTTEAALGQTELTLATDKELYEKLCVHTAKMQAEHEVLIFPLISH